MTWLKENEEKKGDQPYLVRPGKLNQLKADRQKTLSSRCKGAALMVTMTLLAAEGVATLQRTPSKGKKKGKWNWWIEDSAEWMVEAGWIAEGERGELVRKARLTASEYEIGGEPELRVLNLGEGGRSIAKAVLKHYPAARVVGVDKRGFTWTGYVSWRGTSQQR